MSSSNRLTVRQLLGGSLGNVLEWFDFGLFIYLAPVIGYHFFPTHSVRSSTVIVFVVFAVGFICRPLGGILLGHLGDRIGRAKTLIWSISAISFSTFLVGILPTYQTVGVLAPILFTMCRLVQGFSVGGEYSGVIIYLAESAPAQHRGFFTSFAAVGAGFGFLLATGMAYINSNLSIGLINHWQWRIPFITSGFLGLIILYYRIWLVETAPFQLLLKAEKTNRAPLLQAFKNVPKNLWQIFGMTCMGSTFYYMFFGYMPTYLHQYFNLSLPVTLKCQSLVLTLMLFFLPLAGWLGDRFGRKKMLIMVALGIMFLTIPCFYFMQSKSVFLLLMGMGIAGFLSSLEQGNSLATFVENCPLDVRYSGISFAYNMGNMLFGGTAPLIVSLLAGTNNNFAPAYYLIFTAIVSFCFILSLRIRVDGREFYI